MLAILSLGLGKSAAMAHHEDVSYFDPYLRAPHLCLHTQGDPSDILMLGFEMNICDEGLHEAVRDAIAFLAQIPG